MGDRRLLDRVRSWDKGSIAGSRHISSHRVDSVNMHLQKLLNSRQGTTLMDRNYGMPDFMEMTERFPDSVRDIERSVAETIEKYEPRLSLVKVDFLFQDEQSLSLIFEIRAKLETEEGISDVYLESSIESGGKLNIRG